MMTTKEDVSRRGALGRHGAFGAGLLAANLMGVERGVAQAQTPRGGGGGKVSEARPTSDRPRNTSVTPEGDFVLGNSLVNAVTLVRIEK